MKDDIFKGCLKALEAAKEYVKQEKLEMISAEGAA